jgi:protein-S-isoprenylcysteine O-methyltransferase Ste14
VAVSDAEKAPGWRVGNIPVPEAHLAGLVAGLLLAALVPWRPPWAAGAGRAVGVVLVLAGVALAAWAVRAAADVDLVRPGRLVRGGPYEFSRNPMYLAWTLAYAGVALVAGSVWPLLLLPAVMVATHVSVVREERALERRFGPAYAAYKASVRRYL